MSITVLRSGSLENNRFYALEAARLRHSEQYEAWMTCGRLDVRSGVGAASDMLKAADTVDELREWADALEEDEIRAIIADFCP